MKIEYYRWTGKGVIKDKVNFYYLSKDCNCNSTTKSKEQSVKTSDRFDE